MVAEKKKFAGYGAQLVVGFSPVIESEGKDFEQFWAEVSRRSERGVRRWWVNDDS